MSNYLSKAACSSMTPYVLFVQPYAEGLNNCRKAFYDHKSPLVQRITRAVIGCGLLVPIINSVVLLILRKCNPPTPQNNTTPPQIQMRKIQSLPPIPAELHFSRDDLTFLANRCWGLRHVSSREAAIEETQKGFPDGCSLSLAPHQAKLNKMEEKSWLQIRPTEEQQFIEHFEAGVDAFILGSLHFDAHKTPANALIEFNKTRHQAVANLIYYCCFSFVDYSHSSLLPHAHNAYYSYDHSVWGQGLGRFPKLRQPKEHITSLPHVNIQHLRYSAAELQDVIETRQQADALYARLIGCYRTILIQTLREKCEASLSQQSLANAS